VDCEPTYEQYKEKEGKKKEKEISKKKIRVKKIIKN